MMGSQKRNQFDVAILGSGISGTILGTILSKHGVNVVILEAKTHPRFMVGESTIPHTSLLLSTIAARYGVPEIDDLAYPDRIAERICSTCGVKRAFGFAYQREGEVFNHREGLQFGTGSKDESHLFRQDVDAHLVYVALRYGVEIRQNTRVTAVNIDSAGASLKTAAGDEISARYVIDGTGRHSPLAQTYDLREEPCSLQHHSRALFTHMVDVEPFEEARNPLTLSWHKNTLHHIFERGWMWVIPFNNREGSTNPLISVGLMLDPRAYPKPDVGPEEEFRLFIQRYPSVARQFANAKTARPWVSTDRIQYSARSVSGYRYSLMAHAAGFVDPLFSRGLINTFELIYALIDPLLAALKDDDFAAERFAHLERLAGRLFRYADRLVCGSYDAFIDFDLWNAWLRVWALGTIITEFRLMNALTDFTSTGDLACLESKLEAPVFSDFEDPDYAAFFQRAVGMMDDFRSGEACAQETSRRIFEAANEYEFMVPVRLDAMRRARWMTEKDEMSDRSLEFARQGYRWALTNPTTHDLFGTAETLYRWRAKLPDPHLVTRRP